MSVHRCTQFKAFVSTPGLLAVCLLSAICVDELLMAIQTQSSVYGNTMEHQFSNCGFSLVVCDALFGGPHRNLQYIYIDILLTIYIIISKYYYEWKYINHEIIKMGLKRSSAF